MRIVEVMTTRRPVAQVAFRANLGLCLEVVRLQQGSQVLQSSERSARWGGWDVRGKDETFEPSSSTMSVEQS
jgi:hypothetical protein